MKLNKNVLSIAVLILAVFASYANTFRNEFAWDDAYFIVDNIHSRNLEEMPGFFVEHSPGDLYRPIRSVFYTIIYQLFGLNVFGYHLNSFLLHLAVTIVLYFITLKITEKASLSFAASLFFAVHPIHAERVTNMTAGFDIYGILFLLLALFFYISFSKSNIQRHFIFSNVFYFLALFSSEEAITLIPLLILYELSFNNKINFYNIISLLKKYISYILITIFYLIARFSVLQKIGREEIYFNESFLGTVLTTVKIFVQYIGLLFFPVGLVTERYVKFESSPLSLGFLIPLALLSLLLFFFVKSYKKSKIIFFSIGWFFITLLPFSNLFPQITIMAERYLYLPSYGFCLLLAFFIFSIDQLKLPKLNNLSNFIEKNSKAIIISAVLIVTLSFSFLAIQRNAEWKDNFTLLSKTIERNPYGTRTYNALALHYRQKGDYGSAYENALHAVELSSKNYHAYETLGTISAYQKDYEQAIYYYNMSLSINSDFYLALNNLGLIYSYTGEFDQSIFYLKKAINSNPNLAKAYNDLGVVYGQLKDFDNAILFITKAMEINPYEPSYYRNLALIHKHLGNDVEAKRLMEKSENIGR